MTNPKPNAAEKRIIAEKIRWYTSFSRSVQNDILQAMRAAVAARDERYRELVEAATNARIHCSTLPYFSPERSAILKLMNALAKLKAGATRR